LVKIKKIAGRGKNKKSTGWGDEGIEGVVGEDLIYGFWLIMWVRGERLKWDIQ
jgi:hypothetical protein